MWYECFMRGEYLANLACRGIMTIVQSTPGIAAQPSTRKRLAVTQQALRGALQMLWRKSMKSCTLPASFAIRLVSWPVLMSWMVEVGMERTERKTRC